MVLDVLGSTVIVHLDSRRESSGAKKKVAIQGSSASTSCVPIGSSEATLGSSYGSEQMLKDSMHGMLCGQELRDIER
jgi:hypothetical protein